MNKKSKNRTQKLNVQRRKRKNINKNNKSKMHTKSKRKYTRRFLSIKVPDSVTTVTLFQKTQEKNNELKNRNHKSEGNIISGMRSFLSR